MFRSELHVAFVNQQRLTLRAAICNVDRTFDPAPDEIWAWRMILHYRDCLTYALEPGNAGKYDQLCEYGRFWMDAKPDSFLPTLEEPANPDKGIFLPEVWYHGDCHGMDELWENISTR